jgi:hypothetical protein
VKRRIEHCNLPEFGMSPGDRSDGIDLERLRIWLLPITGVHPGLDVLLSVMQIFTMSFPIQNTTPVHS